MTALVTGASGLIGFALVRALLRRGERVRVLLRAKAARAHLAPFPVEIADGDICDPVSLDHAMKGVTSVFHAAAVYRLWSRDPGEIYAANVGGARNVFAAAMAAGVGHIVHTSSVCTIGVSDCGAVSDENTAVIPTQICGAYKASKFQAEDLAREYARKGAPIVIVNPSTPIGPGDLKPTPTGKLVAQAADGKMPAFVDTGLNFVHVDDVAEGHILARDHGRIGERYILGGENMSLRDFLGRIAALTGRRAPTLALPRKAIYPIAVLAEAMAALVDGDPFVTVNGLRLAKYKMYFFSEKAIRELGYRPRASTEAIRDAVEWFQTSAAKGPLARPRPSPGLAGD